MNNGTDIRKAMRAAKQSPKKQDGLKGVIYDQRGQYAFPGQVTKIQGDAYGTPITMAGVPYPMYGEDDLGYGQMMYPGMEYAFPGSMVYEMPMMRGGGLVERPILGSIKDIDYTLSDDKKQKSKHNIIPMVITALAFGVAF